MWPFDQIRETVRKDTALLRESASATGRIVKQAQPGWRILLDALRGHPPIITEEAAIKLRRYQHIFGGTAAALAFYVGLLGASGYTAPIYGAAILSFVCTLGAIVAGLMLLSPRVPEDRRLEYRPEPPMPQIRSED